MHEITLSQAAEKAYQAEIILALMQEKKAVRMEDSEVDALIVMLRNPPISSDVLGCGEKRIFAGVLTP